jgi:hypothetical protein
MEDSPDKNLGFLQNEVLAWLGQPINGEEYHEMWADIPNISEYAQTASDRISDLQSKMTDLLLYKPTSNSRSFELRFPHDYCPIHWSFALNADHTALEASLIFRSLEVSRNLLNDLYLFCVYFGYIFTTIKDSKPFEINIEAMQITALDAHIIDFGGEDE